MMDSIKQGMITHFEKEGYDDLEAREVAQELFEDLDGALEDAHGDDSNLSSSWVADLVSSHLGGNFELLGAMVAMAYMENTQPIVDAGIPQQFYDHIMIMS